MGRNKDRIIRTFYVTLGVALVVLGIISLLVPVLPGILMMLIGFGIISPPFRERMFETGRRWFDRLPIVRRFRRRQVVRLVLIIIGSVLAGAALAFAAIYGFLR